MNAPSYREAEHIILAEMSGDTDLAEIRRLRLEVIALAVEHNCFRVLVDATRVNLKLSVDEIFAQANETREALDAEGLAPFQLKRAVVVAPGNTDARFYEDVAVTRGHAFRLFATVDDAKAWLQGSPAPGTDSARTP